MLTITIRSKSSFTIITFLFFSKDCLVFIILFIYLERNLLEKFNLNLSYILIKVLNPNNPNNKLYKIF